MSVRAKFRCVENDGQKQIIRLEPVTSGSKENEQFFKYTPGGSIVFAGLANPAAAEQFVVGEEYYVDFTKAPTS